MSEEVEVREYFDKRQGREWVEIMWKAGRELDALVAEKVMGLSIVPTAWGPKLYHSRNGSDAVPPYSTDIAAAWEVVEKLLADGFEVSDAGYAMSTRMWDFTFGKGSAFEGRSETAALAICLAALRATEGNK